MNEPNRHSRRRWFQISLRSIFLVTLFVAACLARYRSAIRQIEQAQQAARDASVEAQKAREEAKRLGEERTQSVRVLSLGMKS
jgi:hypothetical protein